MSFWNKKIKNVKEISRRTGIEEEKIKELKEGKREIGGDTMDKVLKAIDDSKKETKLEKDVREKEIYDWCINNDIMKLIKDFGYRGQTEIAPVIGVQQSFISNLVGGKIKGYTANVEKLYNFFQDDFNKKAIVLEPKKRKIKKGTKANLSKEKEEEINDFFKNNDLKDICEKLNTNSFKLCKSIGVSRSTLINTFSNGQYKYKYITPLIVKIYDYLIKELKEDEKIDNIIERTKAPQILTKEVIKTIPPDTETSLNEAKNEEKQEETKRVIIEVDKDNYYKLIKDHAYLTQELIKENNKIEQLSKQIERYEKLIDRL